MNMDGSNNHRLEVLGTFIDSATINRFELKNTGDKPLYFKVMTTAPKIVCVKPNSGLIEPSNQINISVIYQPFEVQPTSKPNIKCLIKSIVACDNYMDNIERLNKSDDTESLKKISVKCVFDYEKFSQVYDAITTDDDVSFDKLYSTSILKTPLSYLEKSWLELAVDSKAKKVIQWFLDKPIDASDISYIEDIIEHKPKQKIRSQLWLETLLYKSIRDRHEKGFKLSCLAKVVNAQPQIISSSFLEVAAGHGNRFFVLEILRKSIFESETWERAKRISVKKGHDIEISRSIGDRELLLHRRRRANLSILHTAVTDNDPDMVEFILDRGLVDSNQNHEVLGTALALAILLCHEKCITVLERFNVDCNTQNKYLQNPLMEAISNGMIDDCRYLIDRAQNINETGFLGQTALHCAVMYGCEELCEKLLKKGADCIGYMEFLQHSAPNKEMEIKKGPLRLSKRETPLTLCMKINETLYPCFRRALDITKANSSDDELNTLLHFGVHLFDHQLCNDIIQAGANVNLINRQGRSPLDELLLKLNQLTFDMDDKNMKKEMTNLMKSLLTHSNGYVKQGIVERVLYHLSKFDDKDSFEYIMNMEIINPGWLEDGETLLTKLLKEIKIDFCQKIIQSEANDKKFINLKNKKNQTPLQIAIETESMDIVHNLIFTTDNLNNEDSEGRTALMQLFEKLSNNNDKTRHFQFMNAVKTIISEGGDIYQETSKGLKIIQFCSRRETKEEIERLFQSRRQKHIVEKKTCDICMDKEVDSVFDCGHTTCQSCSEKLVQCPFCGFAPARAKRLYLN